VSDTADPPRDPPSPSRARRIGNNLWWFFNTTIGVAIAVWLLTSVVLGIIVWQYQQWQQAIQARIERTQKIERLNLELAARMSQFGTWARSNLLTNNQFQPGITDARVEAAIREMSKAPDDIRSEMSKAPAGDVIPIDEMFPENSKRNMLSLYGELAQLTQDQQINHDVADSILDDKKAVYNFAEIALIEPRALFGYRGLNYDEFICQFKTTFLTADIGQYHLPSTDCLETKDNACKYPSTPDFCKSLLKKAK
jgi:hypothetical protein